MGYRDGDIPETDTELYRHIGRKSPESFMDLMAGLPVWAVDMALSDAAVDIIPSTVTAIRERAADYAADGPEQSDKARIAWLGSTYGIYEPGQPVRVKRDADSCYAGAPGTCVKQASSGTVVVDLDDRPGLAPIRMSFAASEIEEEDGPQS